MYGAAAVREIEPASQKTLTGARAWPILVRMCDQNKTEAPDPVQMKEKLYAQAEHGAGVSQGTAGLAYENEPRRPSLRERVNDSFYRAERESRKLDRLKELAELLDTNPALARILELIEETHV